MMDVEIQGMFETEPLANWNGEQMPLSEVRVSVLDRAFLFGDGIYEVIRVYDGRPFLYSQHLDRLARNLDKLSLSTDIDNIKSRIEQTIAATDFADATVYIQVTRGVAPRTHRYPRPTPEPNVLIYVAKLNDPYREYRQDGAAVIVTPDMRWKRCDIKSLNLLANCMASEAAHAAGCVEALLVDESGKLIEGSRSSLFGVRDGMVLTAPLGAHILPGITRRLLMTLCERASIAIHEEAIFQDEISTFDELFLTGTTMEILPVVKVDETTIGSGRPGPVVRSLVDEYKRYVDEFKAS